MKDKSHLEQVERWAEHVKTNSNWKSELKQFIDSQVIMARRAYAKLAETEEGRKKIRMIKNI